ncbi:S-methyl-5'-thioadenosine phosphorylase [Nitrososphaera viennensis]|uniref:Purine nucleoside phosphorylase n=2 Tax=Nitrososphaera viennensis TaxID=1034015 RepID=A0A060HR46_9ARCH|nr:S-methyl-5'-thioadenosine phosphorylase [Nitrososphaera viennensis]AIC15981.1 5'-methylthioadenosine phosphorylase [Nitrososphaera viennensis EN76]UVS67957.1 S-methyl-5'-thioadenosine phosphorylase [Nitrososphaera viennensis]
MEKADIGIIGGTGVYDSGLFSDKKEVKVHTPYGEPSDLITIGEYAGRKVAFLPRHGRGHRIPPHRINFRANIWALKQLGVKRIIAPSAVGSLGFDYKPGHVALPDQFIDFTKKREYTFYDGGQVAHVSMADPFCPEIRDVAAKVIEKLKFPFQPRATYVCIEGPRFSTRAESKFFRDVMKADIIGMTLVPEVTLAREAEICYLSVATVTDYDVWAEIPVTSKEIIETLHKNVEKTKKLVAELIPAVPMERAKCACGNALEGSLL